MKRTCLRIVCAATIAAIGSAALGQSRPASPDMTCGQARQFVSTRGTAILGTGGQSFDRFVRDRSFCESTQITSNAFVPTRDDRQCLVGYRCLEPGQDLFGDDS